MAEYDKNKGAEDSFQDISDSPEAQLNLLLSTFNTKESATQLTTKIRERFSRLKDKSNPINVQTRPLPKSSDT